MYEGATSPWFVKPWSLDSTHWTTINVTSSWQAVSIIRFVRKRKLYPLTIKNINSSLQDVSIKSFVSIRNFYPLDNHKSNLIFTICNFYKSFLNLWFNLEVHIICSYLLVLSVNIICVILQSSSQKSVYRLIYLA